MNQARHERQDEVLGPQEVEVNVSGTERGVVMVPVSMLKVEEGTEHLLKSPNMRPYTRLVTLLYQQHDPRPALEEIAEMPLKKRYVWRVVSALKRAFGDFDSLNARADVETLPPEDLEKVLRLLQFRPRQFCIFLSVLLGKEAMEQVMIEAINAEKE